MSFSDWKKKAKKAQSQKQPQHKSQKQSQEQPEIVNKSCFSADSTLPLVYKPTVAMLDLAAWYKNNAEQIQQDLKAHGAVLFRGFKVDSQAHFQAFADVAITSKAAYIEGATPRTELGGGIYTSTEFAQEQEIKPHNELSYVTQPPSVLAFCCLQAPATGGQTPLTDVSKVYKRIEQPVLDEFDCRGGWQLQRHYVEGFGPTINKAFGIDNIDDIKRYCDEAKVELEVISDTEAMTRQQRPAVHQHPVSGEPLWFNHVVFWHPSSLCDKVRAQLGSVFETSRFPYHTRFADGSEIAQPTIEHIRQAYSDEEVVFDWFKGDVLLVDNWRVAHGRKPFTGPRQVLVAMG